MTDPHPRLTARAPKVEQRDDWRDRAMASLGIGAGVDSMDEADLVFLDEVVPKVQSRRARGRVCGTSRIVDSVDKCKVRSDQIYLEREIREVASAPLRATVRQTVLCRGDGCFGANDPSAVRAWSARFSAPVIPGDRPRIEVWRESGGRVADRTPAPARSVVTVSNGTFEVAT